MKAVVQCVSHARVVADGVLSGEIGQGLMILLGVAAEDTEEQAALLAKKTAELRIFCDENDKMNLSLLDVGGGALVVSNFTLCADASHGRRPSFIGAKEPAAANHLYEYFVACLKNCGVHPVQTGRFGADMAVTLTNEGPVTLILNTDDWKSGHAG